MDPGDLNVRRATLDDLPVLKGLWEVNRLPALELERHLTEFQIVSRPDGVAVGAIALRSHGTHGLLHSEAFYSAAQAEPVRMAVWARLQVLARNQRLARLWMRGDPLPGWDEAGFRPAAAGDLKKLPAVLRGGSGRWSTVALVDETVLAEVAEREVAAFQAEARADHDRLRRQALWLKWIAALIAFGFFAGAFWLLFQVLTRGRHQRGR